MSKLDEAFTCSILNSDFKPVKRSEIKFPKLDLSDIVWNKCLINGCTKLTEMVFPKDLSPIRFEVFDLSKKKDHKRLLDYLDADRVLKGDNGIIGIVSGDILRTIDPTFLFTIKWGKLTEVVRQNKSKGEIKVGQIYEAICDGYKERFVLTKKYQPVEGLSDVRFDVVYQDGVCRTNVVEYYVANSCKLIAEYPTWQEAVNSKEFKND